jgi:hypothetical protein
LQADGVQRILHITLLDQNVVASHRTL